MRKLTVLWMPWKLSDGTSTKFHVKITSGLIRDGSGIDQELLKEADGSVKVALIGIDRSIIAWGILRDCFPEKTDDLLSILLHLDRLRRQCEKEFPNARTFVRPGFDTVIL